MSRQTTEHRRSPDRRTAVLAELRAADEPVSVADLAAALRVHPNTVRFHLDALAEQGRVIECADTRESVGRPRRLFRAAPGMDSHGPMNHRLLAEIVVDDLSASPNATERAVEIGRRWGRTHFPDIADDAPVTDGVTARERLRALLTQLEFAPTGEADEKDGSTIGLRHCPFLDAARDHPNVVCAIHLGLMRGALDVWKAPVSVESLEAFATPDRCVVHLRDS